MIDQNRSWPLYSLTALAAISLAGFAYLGSYTRFMADDFCSAFYADRFGLLRSIWYWYLNWSGRYSAFVFDWLELNTFGRYGAHLIPPLLLSLWLILAIAAIYMTLRRLMPEGKNFPAALALGALFVSVAVLLSPDIPQSFLWLNGLRSYSLPLVNLTLYVFLFQWMLPQLRSGKAMVWACILAFILAFGDGGMSETYAVFQFVLLGFLAALKWFADDRKMSKTFFLLTAGFLGALAAVIVIALAPGNAVRQAALPPSPGLGKLLSISWAGYAAFISGIVLNPHKITALTGALLAAVWIGTRYKDRLKAPVWLIPVAVVGGLGLSFACFPPAVFGYSEPPPLRTMSIAVFGLTGFLFYAAFLIGCLWARQSKSVQRFSVQIIVLALLLTGTSSALTVQSVLQRRGGFVSFAGKWDAVDAQILAAKAGGAPSVTIPAMTNWADLDRPSDNPKFWATACYSEYYGIQVYGPPY